MSFELLLRAEAREDLTDIRQYYNKISPDLATGFFIEFLDKIEFIKSEPQTYQIRYRGIRIAPLKRFPYGIHYFEKGDQIIVLRVLHTKRFFK